MAKPVLLTINGTGSAVWTPDWMENPFAIGMTAVTGTTGVNGTAIVEYTGFNPNSFIDSGVVSTAVYFTVIAATGASTTANFTTPCQAIRASVVTATATSSWQFTFVQATTPP